VKFNNETLFALLRLDYFSIYYYSQFIIIGCIFVYQGCNQLIISGEMN